MSFKLGDRVQVVKINFNHTKRQMLPMNSTKGSKGIIRKISTLDQNAYYVMLDEMSKSVYLYQDELRIL